MAVIYLRPDQRPAELGEGVGNLFAALFQHFRDTQALDEFNQTLTGDTSQPPQPQRSGEPTADSGAVQAIQATPVADQTPAAPKEPDFNRLAEIMARASPQMQRSMQMGLETYRMGRLFSHEKHQEELQAAREQRAEARETRAETRQAREEAYQDKIRPLQEMRAKLEIDRLAFEREEEPLKKQEMQQRILKQSIEIRQAQHDLDLGMKADSAPQGANALDGVDPGEAALVKGMVEGRIAPPSSFALSRPVWQARLKMALKLDPTFDETKWSQRVETARDYGTGGKAGLALRYGNNAVHHLALLQEAFTQLGNGNVSAWNAIRNQIKSSVQGDPALSRFGTAQEVVSEELRKFFAAAGGGSLEELKQWEKNFSSSLSPDRGHGSILEATKLMYAQFDTLADQWNRIMGGNKSPLDFMSPGARQAWQQIGGFQGGVEELTKPGGPKAPPTDSVERANAAIREYKAGPQTKSRHDALIQRLKDLGIDTTPPDTTSAGSVGTE